MSFVSATRDYFEILNNISNSFGTDFTFNKFIIESFFYFLKSVEAAFFYLLSFQWLRDFTLLPIIVPQNSSSVFKETFFLETPSKLFFNFLEIPTFSQNTFLVGFLNSIFLTLPISITHIISIRRLLIQGIPAGVFSIGGYILGQILFLIPIIFGWRWALVPWLTSEPFTYIIGLILIFRIIYTMSQENLIQLRGWNQPKYLNFFFTSLLLAWCEQSSVFQYLGNLSLTPNPTLLEGFASNTPASSFLTHTFYLFGILIGSILFSGFWVWLFLQLKNFCIWYTPLFLSRLVQSINKVTFVIALGCTLSTIPFYGIDYLITGPLGFISQDRVFKNTLLDQHNVKDVSKVLGLASAFHGLDLDVSVFDRGRYLLFPAAPELLSFEDLNYRGEAEWVTRYDKLTGITDTPTGMLTLGKLFKKQKSSFSPSQIDSQKPATTQKNIIIDRENSAIVDPTTIGTRFSDWYHLQSKKEEKVTVENTFRHFYNSSFPIDFLRTEAILDKNIEQKIKSKYYSNPIYKNLLKVDIDFFLIRQPATFRLSSENEADLYTKRRILTSYYDSLRAYAKLPYSQDFENFFDGSKSFANKVYNQQFKGTLRSVRRLFSLTLDTPETQVSTNSQNVLKYDQPLYQLSELDKFSGTHEELPEQLKSTSFLNEFVSTPFYAGWDEQIRKFVITNKLLSRNLAGYKINISSENRNKFSKPSRSIQTEKNKPSEKIKFTVWPITSQKILDQQTEQNTYITLYESQPVSNDANDIEDQDVFKLFSNLPANWQTIQRQKTPSKRFNDVFDYLAPKRGGFIWPGNSTPNWTF
jgi:hypothetical protein